MKDNLVQVKTYDFALRAVRCCQYLKKDCKEHVLSRQLLRSGTSVGANVEEAIGARSRRDFIAKLSISYKEARETHYWLRLLGGRNYGTEAASVYARRLRRSAQDHWHHPQNYQSQF